mgnify:FL=1
MILRRHILRELKCPKCLGPFRNIVVTKFTHTDNHNYYLLKCENCSYAWRSTARSAMYLRQGPLNSPQAR